MVIVSHGVVHSGAATCFFPSSDANTALKAATIIRGGRMLSILLFSANLCGNQHSLALSGAGHFINTGPTHWLESWAVHSLYTLGCEIGERRVFSCVCVGGVIRSTWPWAQWAECGIPSFLYRINYHPVAENRPANSSCMNNTHSDSQFRDICNLQSLSCGSDCCFATLIKYLLKHCFCEACSHLFSAHYSHQHLGRFGSWSIQVVGINWDKR